MNRNKLMMTNTIVVLVTMIINTILGMIEIRVFIHTYGDIINGIIQTGNQVLGYLSLIEGGIGASFLYYMYKPTANQDFYQVSSIFNGFNKTISKVVYKMIIAAIIISFIYPLFIRSQLGEGHTYISVVIIFVLISLRTILPYKFSVVPKNMILLKEKYYKAEFISGIGLSIQLSLEVLIIIYYSPPVYVVLALSVIISLLNGIWYKYEMNKLYKGQLVRSAIPNYEPNTMSKNVFAHNISSLIFNSTDNIIISFFSLTNVTIYSSYNMIIQKSSTIIRKIIQGASATLSLKISRDEDNAYEVFREILVASYSIGAIVSSVFIVMMNQFMNLWLGSNYLLSSSNVLLFGLILYSGCIMPSLYIPRDAKGLYKESKNFTIIQSVVNLVFTLLLVPSIGITGALIGTIIARFFITLPMNYRLVYKKVFLHRNEQMHELLFNVFLILSIVLITNLILGNIAILSNPTIVMFLLKTLIVCILSSIFVCIYYFLTDKAYMRLIKRVINK